MKSGRQNLPLSFLSQFRIIKDMKKVALETIGCRLNQYETERIAARLTEAGFERVEYNQPADLYIINTCTVTGRADASSRNIINRAARRDYDPAVVVVGCYVDSDPEKISHMTGVDLIVSNKEKESIVPILKERFPHLFTNGFKEPALTSIGAFHQHNRAWIKIGDGCNQRCAYCIIPMVRGELANRDPDEIVDEINLLSKNGYNEVVLTGVHIGKYKHGKIKSIASLLDYLLDKSDIFRVRLSSIEPQEVDDDLVKAINMGGERICRHLHIPLQSGSDRILKIMRRPYNMNRYLEIVSKIKESIDGVTVGADIIVGFPGETDDDFAESINAADSGMLDYLHVFSYSDRSGTDASKMPDKIPPHIIKERNAALREIGGKHYAKRLKEEVGKNALVISEHRPEKGKHFWGITDNYLKVKLPVGIGGGKELINIKIISAANSYLTGNAIK